MASRTYYSWGTQTEINHLRKLGTFGLYHKDKKTILRKYLKAMELRRDWGSIEPQKVKDFAVKLLEG